ncbi:MAG: hypothetical protein EHM24_04080, partial [Acidobacteria bacterium]
MTAFILALILALQVPSPGQKPASGQKPPGSKPAGGRAEAPQPDSQERRRAAPEPFTTPLTLAEMTGKQAVMETTSGRIVIDLLPQAAP